MGKVGQDLNTDLRRSRIMSPIKDCSKCNLSPEQCTCDLYKDLNEGVVDKSKVTSHTQLVGLSDTQLLLLAPEATHQHYKGGLYRWIGNVYSADTGCALVDADGENLVGYEHCFPYNRDIWMRSPHDFYGTVKSFQDDVKRFRRLKR